MPYGTKVNQCELTMSDGKLQMLLKRLDSVFQDEVGTYNRNSVGFVIDPLVSAKNRGYVYWTGFISLSRTFSTFFSIHTTHQYIVESYYDVLAIPECRLDDSLKDSWHCIEAEGNSVKLRVLGVY